jgi:heptosyltransferase-3
MSRRIGILRTGSLGDHLIALPLYRQLRAAHAADALVLVCNIQGQRIQKLAGPASILPGSLFDEFHFYPVGSDWQSIKDKYRLFRSLNLDALYYLMPPRNAAQLWRDRLFFWLARVPVIGLRTGATAQNVRLLPNSKLYEHEADRLARGVPLLTHTLRKEPQDLSIELSDAERAEARELLGGTSDCMLVVSIGTKVEVNDWGIEKWSQLVSQLAELRNIDRLVLIGASDEHADSEKLMQKWPRQSYNFCGRLPPRLSAAVLADAKLFVGHNSGPMHMAAAVNVPIVAISSSRDLPGVWFPLNQNKRVHYTVIECMGCGKLKCEDRKKECIRRISVADVYASCVAALT